MHEKIESAIKSLNDKIFAITRTEEDLILCERLMPDASIWLDENVNISWYTKSFDEVKSTLVAFAKEGILIDHYVSNDTHPTWYLRGKNCLIRLLPWWPTEETGTACRLVQVGERTITTPVYKLVCKDRE